MKMEHVFHSNRSSPTIPSSRMLLAGIQAESGLDPRLKHSGVTILESHLFARAVIFKREHEGHGDRKFLILNRVFCVSFDVIYS
jgi:hypothetical protein